MNYKTKTSRIVALLLAVVLLLPMMPAVELHVHAEAGTETPEANAGGIESGTGTGESDTGTTDTGTTETGTTETDTTETGSTESGTGATDSTAGTAYGQDTGICTTCNGTYINGICSNADCTDPYQEPNRDDSGTVFLIENAGNLYWFAKCINDGSGQADAKLTADIVVNKDVLKEDGSLNEGTSTLKQWTPIGNSSNAYAGTFDGDGHTISGLYYNGSDSYVGLFGYIQGGARIQNVGVIDSCFQASGERAYLGGIVGYAYVYVYTDPITISDCSSAVLLTSTAQSACIGGVVGYVSSDGESVTIQNCFNTGDVTVTSADSYSDAQCGGVAGYVCVYNGSVMIENCSNTGDVTVTSTSGMSYFGGVVGYVYANDASATIRNCFNTGKLTETSTSGILYCGGVVGYAHSYKGNVTIRGCFNTGEITATSTNSYCGGVAGYAYAYADAAGQGTVTLFDCYYLSTVAGNAIGNQVTSETGGKVTTEKVATKTAAQFASGEVAYLLNGSVSTGKLVWHQTIGTDKIPNFTSTQIVYAYTNCMGTTSYTNDSTQESGVHGNHENGLCAVCGGDYEEPSTDANGVYQIANAGNLYWFANFVNQGGDNLKANAKLAADIDLENRAWTAIGTAEKPYTGTFDGGNFTISNFSLTVAGNNQGLFGAVSGGKVKNFTLKGKIDIAGNISNVGSAVGYAKDKALIENVTSYVVITDVRTDATERVSGIGGIVGYMDGSTVKGCTYDGTITSVCGASIAGIVGNASNSSTVDHCTNKGNVTAENNSAHIGGIAGDAQTGTAVSYCLNFGDVTSSGGDCIGGIVAYSNQNVKIVSCGNLGTINCKADGDGFIGGILGYINNNNFKGISNCFNYGNIVTNKGKTAHAGAILGYNRESGNVYSNNYYLDTSCTKAVSDNAISDVYAMTSTQFTSGEVTYKLNGSKNAGAWKQTLGEGGDSSPNFTGKDVNYGYVTCKDTQMSYSNGTVSNTPVAHSYGDAGFCTVCGAYQPAEQNTDGYYEIGNLGQLLWFAEKVNSGETSISAKLTADIDATSVSYIGIGKDATNAFAGTFDGNYKTLKIALVSKEQYVAPFPYINGATINNLTVSGTIRTTHKFAAGIVGRVESGNVTLENCLSLVAIDSTNYSGDGTHGGLIGVAASKTTINNCGFAGSIIGESTTDCAGIVGWTDATTKTNISNSYVAATFKLKDNKGNTFGRNPSYVELTNCYYLNALSDASTATQMSAESFASGEVAYLLNGKTNAGAWKQTLGEGGDSYPNFGGKDVYYGYANCTATEQSYINEPYTTTGHHYNDNGFCKRCDDYEAPTLVDGYYEIDNAGKLYWFADFVNQGGENLKANAKLTADITVNPGKFDADGNYTVDGASATPMDWTPIGDSVNKYDGTFDGNGKFISGLYVNSTDNCNGIGLFGCVGQNGAVKAVAVKNFYIKGASNVGGVAGANSGLITNCTSSGIVTGDDWYVGGVAGINSATGEITNCSNSGTVSGSGSVGGVAGYNGKTITNCFNSGTVTGSDYIGGVVGYNSEATITSCYNSGAVNGSIDVGGVVGYNDSTVTNCYYLYDSASKGIGYGSGDAIKVTDEELKSGEITWLLNGKRSAEDVVWKQTLNGTNLPGFTGGIVYYGYLSCKEGTQIGYTNVSVPATQPDHDYDNGICKVCGKYEPCATDASGVYLIKNAGNLFWFAAKVNSGETSANAKLMADIDLESREWTPIGNMENPYIGTFDGTKYDESGENAIGNYAISGLYVEGNDDRTGLFGLVGEGGTVKNVTVKDAYIEGDQYVGGVVGQNHGGTITNCTVSGTVGGSESVGGVVGYNEGTLTNCTNTATVSGTGDNVGGVVGSNYSGEITNCTVSGTVSGTGKNVGGVVGYDNFGTITNCTNSATVSGTGENVGGVVGYEDWGSIEGCANTGVITGSSSVGGVVGSNKNSGTITGNYNTGRVTGTGDNVGGVAGYSDLEIKNCYNTGVVGGSSYVGGVVGYCNATIANCYNTGKVTGSNYVGGIAGKIENGGCWYCCYLTGTANKAVGEGDGDGAYAMTADEFKSGAATWLLNEEFAGEDVVWKQTLGTDDYPGYSGGIVYGGYAQQCVETRSYTNDSEAANDLKPYPHDYYEHENGICTKCGAYAPCMGKGTAEAPYQITNLGNLYWFAAKVNGGETGIHAELWADITINPGTFDQDGKYTPGEDEAAGTTPRAWTPIGNSTYPYTGIFNGNGHTISGLYYPGEKYDYNAGLFGNVGEGGTVKNVAVTGSYIRGYYAGGVVCSNSGTITGCSYSGTVIGTSGSTGGVAGRNSGTITNCYNTGTVSGKSNVGGVAGFNNGAITNCYNTGAVSGTDELVGGVVGYHYAGNVTNCYNTGTSGAGSVAGGNNATITNCYYLKGTACIGTEYGDSNVTNVEAMTAADFASGKVTWLLNGKTSEGTTESPLVWKQTLSGEDKQGLPSLEGDIVYGGYIKCDEKGKFSNDADEVTGAQTEVSAHQFNDDGFCKDCDAYQPCEGEGTDSEPYKIANAGNLYWFAAQVNSGKTDIRANLTADITVNSNVLKSDGSLNTGTFRAWTPIGSESNKFTGTFDGTKYDEDQYGMLIMVGNYTISGLYFNDTSKDYVGLFGYVGYGGIVEEVVIKDSYFKGKQYVGGVAGYSEDQIYYCSNSGTVSGTYNVGGVAGAIGGINGMIRFCSNSGAVSGAARVGGVVGRNQNSGRVWDCYNTGAVSGTSDIGGVAGCNEGEISDCYNNGTVTGTVDGDVTGTASIGGVVGGNGGSILNCYNSGTISGDGAYNIGGVVGSNSGSISNCYYLTGCAKDGNDTEQYGIGNAKIGSTTADAENVTTGKTKAQFATGEVAWRLNGGNGGAWGQDIGKDDYPCFSSPIVYRYTDCQGNDRFSQVPAESGNHYCDANGFCIAKKSDGTLCGGYEPCVFDNGVYVIKNAGNLYWFANKVNSEDNGISGKLVANIVVNENVLDANGNLNYGDLRAWTPIGNGSCQYMGTFNGFGYTISGLYVDSDDTYIGLFGNVYAATIQNVTVVDSYFASSAAAAYVGGIVGYVDANGGETVISVCTSSGTFEAYAGTAGAYAGGLVGYVNAISGTVQIIGESSGKVSATANEGSVPACAGGIVGYVDVKGTNAQININCTSSCTVEATENGTSATAYAGGIVGYAHANTNGKLNIVGCYNTGAVKAEAGGDYSEAIAGGLVGYAKAGAKGTLNIGHCYNTGNVSATAQSTNSSAYSGGLAGYAASYGTLNIESCYNTGNATATAYYSTSSTCSGCLVGYAASGGSGSVMLSRCYYLGTSEDSAIGTSSGTVTTENVAAVTQEQFKSGEVTWLLNGESDSSTPEAPIVWYQIIGVQSYPGFEGSRVSRSADGTYYNDAKVAGYTLYLNGMIGVNFYTLLSDNVLENADAKIVFGLPSGGSGPIPLAEALKDARKVVMGGQTYYVFTCDVAAHEMTGEITFCCYIGDELVTADSITIKDYAMYIINNPDDYAAADVTFAKALLNYGAASQIEFGYSLSKLANAELADADRGTKILDASVLEEYAVSDPGTGALGTFTGTSLYLDSATSLRAYFDPAEGVDITAITFTVTVDGEVKKTITFDSETAANAVTEYGYMLAYDGLMAYELDKNVTFTATIGDQSVSFTCSAMTYAYNVISRDDTEGSESLYTDELKTLVSALYNYMNASKAYGGTNNAE